LARNCGIGNDFMASGGFAAPETLFVQHCEREVLAVLHKL
jgi:hypothetical protein